jgi:rhodanese-related sulfurtransferase
MQTLDRGQTQNLIEERHDLAVVDVLEPGAFRKFHLPGATNVPLDENFVENIQRVAPDKSQPVLVYCMNTECDASSKAARKLDELGYREVYDYEAGKMDWKDAGLPVES